MATITPLRKQIADYLREVKMNSLDKIIGTVVGYNELRCDGRIISCWENSIQTAVEPIPLNLSSHMDKLVEVNGHLHEALWEARFVREIMCAVNEAVETIIIYKGNRIKNNDRYEKYIKSVLKEHNIIDSETSEETVEVFVKVFKMGAVDAMTYDVGAALDFIKQRDCVDRWTSRKKRKEILRKKFLEE